MSPNTLAALRRDLAGRYVLSVYINAQEHDPARRANWRVRLRSALDEQQHSVNASDTGSFAVARAAVEAELVKYTGFLPGKAWVLFATEDGVQHVSGESVPWPDLVRWRRGAELGPLTRALRQDRPVRVALIDSLRARIFEYRNGTLDEQIDERTDAFIDDLTDRNMSKRATTASGMRGATATDEAERILRMELERHARNVAAKLLTGADEAIVIVGGPTLAVTQLCRLLEPSLGTRLYVDESMHLTMTPAQLIQPVEEAASEVTRRLQEEAVRQLLEAAAPGAAVSLGLARTGTACRLGQVDRLYITAAALAGDAATVEALIGETLDRGGNVELLSGAAADLADGRAGGTVARLRYAPGLPAGSTDSPVTQHA